MELSFKVWLERSRWKDMGWKRPAQDALKRLKKWNRSGYYCHFTDMKDKIGVNPLTIHTDATPFGIYAYPVDYVIKSEIIHLPFAEDKHYIWVLKAKNPKRILKITGKAKDPARNLWLQARVQSHFPGQFHAFFLSRHIEGVVDQGTATIHPSEPYQAVFFGSQTIVTIDVFENNYKEKSKWISNNLDKLDQYYQHDTLGDEDYDDYDPYSDPAFHKYAKQKS